MKKINNDIKINEKTDIVKKIINIPNEYSEINDCEYIYIDTIDLKNLNNSIFKNKTILTKKFDDYFILENTISTKPGLTKLNYKHIVDLLILNNTTIQRDLHEIIDQDTIIIKKLEDNIIYVEDTRKNIKMIITPYEKIIIKNNGINTNLEYYEILN